MLDGREVATRMRAIEDNISGETEEDSPPLDRCVAILLEVEYAGLDDVLKAEALRVIHLQEEWYARLGVQPSAFNYAALGFVQGITFAVAAQRLRDENNARD
jgi:hypothetical protein